MRELDRLVRAILQGGHNISLYKNFRRLDILRKFFNAKIFTTKVFVHENFQIYGMCFLTSVSDERNIFGVSNSARHDG